VAKENLIAFNYFNGSLLESQNGISPRGTAEAGRQWQQGRPWLCLREKDFTVRLAEHWRRFPRDLVGPPSLEVSRGQWDRPGAPGLAVRLALLWGGGLQRGGLTRILCRPAGCTGGMGKHNCRGTGFALCSYL